MGGLKEIRGDSEDFKMLISSEIVLLRLETNDYTIQNLEKMRNVLSEVLNLVEN